MYELIISSVFDEWLSGLPDRSAAQRISLRLLRARQGNLGDWAPVGEGVCEMRLHFGPGYRLYFKRIRQTVYVFFCGGEKGSQSQDIKRALEMARQRGD